jgi:hypothetical protein
MIDLNTLSYRKCVRERDSVFSKASQNVHVPFAALDALAEEVRLTHLLTPKAEIVMIYLKLEHAVIIRPSIVPSG